MDGTNFSRINRLTAYLLSHPNHIPKYLKTSVFNKKEPIDHGLPWISYAAIDFLNKWKIDERTEILELGGGGSTIFFGEKKAKITCLESSDMWAEKITSRCNELALRNVTLEVHPYDLHDKKSFLESGFYKSIGLKKYDIILVDNYEEDSWIRTECFYMAEKSIKEGGIIILDDSWRYSQVRKSNSAKKQCIFQSIGPCRLGVTSTDIYYY